MLWAGVVRLWSAVRFAQPSAFREHAADLRKYKSREWDSNPRPALYKTDPARFRNAAIAAFLQFRQGFGSLLDSSVCRCFPVARGLFVVCGVCGLTTKTTGLLLPVALAARVSQSKIVATSGASSGSGSR